MESGPVSSPPATTADEPDHDRLESWKAVAAYLGRSITTVQRWEREEGLPVRRHAHAARGSIVALRREVDAWRERREAAVLAAPTDPAEAAEAAAIERPGPAPVRPDTAAHTSLPPLRHGVVAASSTAALLVIVAAALLMMGGRSSAPGAAGDAPAAIPRPVAIAHSVGNERHPALSPDGRFVAYTLADADGTAVFVIPADGGAARRLPTGESRRPETVDAYARWSPDGRLLSFLRETRAAVWQVRVVGIEGGPSRPLLEIHSASHAWMPDGATIVVLDRPSQGEPYAAFLVSAENGQRLRQITFPPAGIFGDWQCAVSPDGRELAVVRHRSSYDADLWAIDIVTGHERRLTTGVRGIESVDWAPDGRGLVFSASDAEGQGLWRLPSQPRDGELPVRIVGTEGGGRFPSFSRGDRADGARLVFARAPLAASVWRWDVSQPAPAKRLTTTAFGEEQPAVSPDGRQLAVISSRSGAPELWVGPSSGAPLTQLTFRAQPLASPRWSHDGRSIAFTAWTGDNPDIYTVRADGSSAAWRLTFEPSDEGYPSWSADDRSVYFRSTRAGLPRIWRVPAAGGPAVAVTQGEGSQAIEAPGGRDVYFVRNRTAPGLWRVPVAGGPEVLVLPRVWEGYWDVTARGLVVFDRPGRSLRDPLPVRLYDPLTLRPIQEPGMVPTPSSTVKLGVSASADGRTVYWATQERAPASLMLVRRWPLSERLHARR